MHNITEIQNSFIETLNRKAEGYFHSQRSGEKATFLFAFKSVLLLVIYITAYSCFIFFSSNLPGMLLACAVLGICHVFIPVNISHDAIHQAVSPYSWINSLCKYGFEITGSNSYMYEKKHLEAHYNKENGSKIKAIETQALLLQKKDSGRSVNLPWIFYLFYSQYMIFIRDFALYIESPVHIPAKEHVKLFFFKILYIVAFLILPFIFIDAPWWQIALSLFFMYLVVTVVLVIILLMPTEKMEQSKLDDNNSVNDRWATEVLAHNVDFSPGNSVLNLLAGGANMNVVHYLFSSVNHVHYNRLALIIGETANEFGLLYRKQQLTDVFGIHLRYIKNIEKANA